MPKSEMSGDFLNKGLALQPKFLGQLQLSGRNSTPYSSTDHTGSSMSAPRKKYVQVKIPKGLKAGDTFSVEVGEITKTITVPPGVKPGSKVSVQLEAGGGDQDDREVELHEVYGSKLDPPNRAAAKVTVPGSGKTRNAHKLAKKKARCSMPVAKEEYPGEEFDVVKACQEARLFVSDVVAVAQKTKDTGLLINLSLGNTMFDLIAKQPTLSNVPGNANQFTPDQLSGAMKQNEKLKKLLVSAGFQGEFAGLLKAPEDKIEKFSKSISTSNSSPIVVTRDDWLDAVAAARQQEIDPCRSYTLVACKKFAGMGLTPGGSSLDLSLYDPKSASPVKDCWTASFYRGYWSDFGVYAMNNHPLLNLMFSHRLHPYSNVERAAAFIASMMTSLCGGAFVALAGVQENSASYFILSGVFVTLPTSIIETLCFWLFANPCLLRDRRKTGMATNYLLDCCQALSESAGIAITAIWTLVCSLLFAVIVSDNEVVGAIFSGLIQYWLIWFIYTFLFPFFPCSSNGPGGIFCVWRNLRTLTCGLLPVGQWVHERKTFFKLAREKIELRGIGKFTELPLGGKSDY